MSSLAAFLLACCCVHASIYPPVFRGISAAEPRGRPICIFGAAVVDNDDETRLTTPRVVQKLRTRPARGNERGWARTGVEGKKKKRRRGKGGGSASFACLLACLLFSSEGHAMDHRAWTIGFIRPCDQCLSASRHFWRGRACLSKQEGSE